MKSIDNISSDEEIEVARLYAEGRMGDNWDRNDVNTVAVFYNYYYGYLISELNKEIEKRDEILNSLSVNPYPTDIFPELSKEQLRLIHQVISAHLDIPIDRLTGHIGRLLRKPYQEDIEKLKGNG
jgi:hypothetical protein